MDELIVFPTSTCGSTQPQKIPTANEQKVIAEIMSRGYELKSTVPVTDNGTLMGIQFYFQLRPQKEKLFNTL